VISGISFGYVYRELRLTPREVIGFGIKRFFRLAPLFWIATLGAFLIRGGTWKLILLNFTLVFGLIAPAAYLPTGGWSIGNEVAFYTILPFAIVALRSKAKLFYVLLVASFLFAIWYAFIRLDPAHTLASQWRTYIMPINQVFLFLSGVLVASRIGRNTLSALQSYSVLFATAVAFVLLPVGPDEISLVTGSPRFGYSACCIAVCSVAALGTLRLPVIVDRVLAWGGQTSYAIYLLHPLSYLGLRKIWPEIPVALLLSISIPLTFVAAHFIYRKVEAPMIGAGKQLALQVERKGLANSVGATKSDRVNPSTSS
jgi:peptidoglycan/LPS O-acetylase OafA/YrhL